jgi:hypothetical protein
MPVKLFQVLIVPLDRQPRRFCHPLRGVDLVVGDRQPDEFLRLSRALVEVAISLELAEVILLGADQQ